MKVQEVPKATTAQTYPYPDPNTILAHQLPDPLPAPVLMLEETASLMHSLYTLDPAEIDALLLKIGHEYQGPLGNIRRIAEMLKAEQKRATVFIRPAYFYADEREK